MLGKIKRLLFHNTSTRQTVTKNTIWLGISNIGGRLLRAIIIVYSARLLGPSNWGVFSYTVTLAGFLTIFTDMGINPVLTRRIASGKTPEERAQMLSTTFFVKMVLLSLSVVAIFFIGPMLTSNVTARSLLPLIAFIFVFDTLREFGFSLINALEKMQYQAGLYLLTNAAIVAFGFYFLHQSPTVASLAYSYIAGTALGAVATFFVLRKHFTQLLSRFNRKLVTHIFSLAWPFAISTLLGALMLNTDILLLGWIRSAEEVGYYSSAQKIIQLLYVLPTIIAVSVLPTFSRLANQDNEKFRRILERIVSVSLAIALPLAIGGYLLGDNLMQLLFGAQFIPAGLPFKILMLTMIIDFPAIILNNALFAYNRQKSLIVYTAIGGLSNVILDLILIPKFGIAGSAIATLLAQCGSNIYLWRKMKSINQFSAWSHLTKTILSAGIMGIIVYLMNLLGIPVIITVAIGVLAYLSAAYVLKDPLFKEIRSIFHVG
ncbi:MAG: flippase [bacterium]|nr:flippase [bacterium]